MPTAALLLDHEGPTEGASDRPTGLAALVLDAVLAATEVQGFPPSVRQLAATCRCSVGTAQRQLDLLEAEGWISRAGGRRRRTVHVLRRPDGRRPAPAPAVAPSRSVDGAVLPVAFTGPGAVTLVAVAGSDVPGIATGDRAVVATDRPSGPGPVAVRTPAGVHVVEVAGADDDVVGAVVSVIRPLAA